MNLPNKITISRIFMIPLYIILLVVPFDWPVYDIGAAELPLAHLLAGIIFLIASLTDWLDGYYARKYNLITNFGKFLDPLADKLLVVSALVCLVALGSAEAWLVILIIAREFAVTGLRLVASGEGIVLAASQMGKLKTVLQISATAFLILHDFPFSYIDFPIGTILLYLATFVTVLSGYDYFKKNWHVMRDSK